MKCSLCKKKIPSDNWIDECINGVLLSYHVDCYQKGLKQNLFDLLTYVAILDDIENGRYPNSKGLAALKRLTDKKNILIAEFRK